MIEDDFGPDVRALLDAGRAQLGPSPDAIARMRFRIDMAAGAAPATTSIPVALKIVGATILTTTIGAAYLVRHQRVVEEGMPMSELSASTPGTSEGLIDVASSASTREASPPPPSQADTAPSDPVIRQRPVREDAPAVSLAREIDLVDRATIAMRNNDSYAALAVLQTYQAETNGNGQLAQDAGALEVEISCRARIANASTTLKAFALRWPESVQLPHLHSICPKETP